MLVLKSFFDLLRRKRILILTGMLIVLSIKILDFAIRQRYDSLTFSVAPDPSWSLITNSYSAATDDEEMRISKFILGHHLDIYIKAGKDKPDKYFLPGYVIRLPGYNDVLYSEDSCGGGKGLGSNCGHIYFYKNNKWYDISFFDFGGEKYSYLSRFELFMLMGTFKILT